MGAFERFRAPRPPRKPRPVFFCRSYTHITGKLRNAYGLGDLKPATRRGEFQTIPGCGGFSSPLHRLLWELLEWHAGVEPISRARSRGILQVAQHDHRLARLRIHAKNPIHSRSAAAVTVGPRLVRPPDLESEAVGTRRELRTRGLGERLGLQ